MRRVLPLAGLATLLLSACGQDVTSTGGSKDQPPGIQTANVVSCSPVPEVSQLTADINALMAYLTPNSQSAQSKWTTVLNDLAANNYAQAQIDLQGLIDFINLKYGQVVIPAGTLIGGLSPSDFKANLFAGLTCYVASNSFDLNPGDPEKVFVNAATDGGVIFPSNFVPTGYNIRITTPPLEALQTFLDRFSLIQIEFVDADGNVVPSSTIEFNIANGLPVVAVCFPTDGSMSEAAKLRALLGHQKSTGLEGFELLESAGVPSALANALACEGGLPAPTTTLGRFLRKAADWFLPEKAYAKFFAVGGVGGSPEEFSPFGAVDPGLTVGGAGGSPEEFAPPTGAAPAGGGPANSTVTGGGTNVTGSADEPNVTDPSQLPKVRVITPGLGTGVDGVVVTFTLSAPDAAGSDPITGPTSEATLCGLSTKDTTDVNGWASVPCINFGTTPGFKNLKATFNPTGVDPLACIIDDTTGLCATATTSVNFLVVTTPGVPASFTPVSAISQNATVNSAVAAPPSVQVKDANENPVPDVAVTFAVTSGGGTVVPAGPTTVSTNSSGIATATSWTLGTSVGTNTVTATAAGLTPLLFTATGTPGVPASMARVSTDPQDATVNSAVAAPPSVQVKDIHENNVPNITVTFDVASGGGSITGGTPSTNSDGIATVGSWTLGTAAGPNELTATAAGPSPVTFTATGTAGSAALIKTFMPPTLPVAAQSFSYGIGLTEAVAVSPAPQVRVTDQFGNPVGAGVGVTWSPVAGSNGSVLVVGGAGTTAAGGLAQVSSWTLGAGLNQLSAEVTGVLGTPATFTGSVPTGQSQFACTVGGSKIDIGGMTFPKPSGTVRTITLYMSITGQSSVEATYNATLTVRKNNASGASVGGGTGGVTLPGNNGAPRAITFALSDVVLPAETAGTGGNAVSTLWFNLTFSNLPGTRKIQVWYNNAITKSNQGACYNSLVYAPGSTTSFKRGLGIGVTN